MFHILQVYCLLNKLLINKLDKKVTSFPSCFLGELLAGFLFRSSLLAAGVVARLELTWPLVALILDDSLVKGGDGALTIVFDDCEQWIFFKNI